MLVLLAVAALVYVVLVGVAQGLRRRLDIRFGATFHLLALAVGLLAGIQLSAWHPATVDVVRRHLGAIAVVLAAFPIATILNRLLWKQAATPRVLADATGILVVLFASLFVLQYVYGVRVPGLLAGSGIVAIILGLALQDLLGNLFAGIALYLQNSFTTGDWLLVDGVHARVVEVSWRSTRLVTTDDVLIDVPNSQIVKNTITNFESPTPRHAIRVTMALHDEVPPARAQAVFQAAAASVEGVLAEPAPVVLIKEFGGSSIVYEIKVWIDNHALMGRVSSDVRSHCWYAARRGGLKLPFETITLRRDVDDRDVVRAREAAARALKAHAIFGFLTSDEIDALIESSAVLLFSPGEHVVEQDAPGESMFLLIRGQVDVRMRRDGHTSSVAKMGAGACFGEMSVLTGEPRNATVAAIEELEVVEITKTAVARLLSANPDVIGRLSELLAERQSANQQLATVATGAEQAASRAGMLRRLRGFFQLT